MAMQTDVKSTYLAATGTVTSQRTRVRGLIVTSAALAGSIVLKDGGAGGTTRIQLDTPAVVGLNSVLLPGEGVLFETDVHATLSNCTISVIYG